MITSDVSRIVGIFIIQRQTPMFMTQIIVRMRFLIKSIDFQ